MQEKLLNNSKSPNIQEECLVETLSGLYLSTEHAKMIWQGNKELIIKSIYFKGSIGKSYYLIGGNECYGIIKILKIDPVDLALFKQLEGKHRISDKERKKWWSGKKTLFAYYFKLEQKFESPKLVAAQSENKTFVDAVQFVGQKQLIQNILDYDPTKLDTIVLKDDFRIALAWWSSKKQGKEVKYSFEEIENLLQLIMEELLRRDIKFHPEEMKPESKEAFDKIWKRINHTEDTILAGAPEFIKYFEDAILQKDIISIVGSSVEKNAYHDIDILVRMSEPTDYLKRAIETRLIKMMPEEFSGKLHFIYGDAEGPHDKFIPVYDLMLVKTEPKLIRMESDQAIFKPMKPAKRFYEIPAILDYMFGG